MRKIKNKFELIERSGECELRLIGRTVEDLFYQALEGLSSLLYRGYPHPCVSPTSVHVRISSVDVNSLLVDFLSEVLYQTEMHRCTFSDMHLRRLTNSELEADIRGCRIVRADRRIRLVTYQGVRVLKHPDGLWQASVIFDIEGK